MAAGGVSRDAPLPDEYLGREVFDFPSVFEQRADGRADAAADGGIREPRLAREILERRVEALIGAQPQSEGAAVRFRPQRRRARGREKPEVGFRIQADREGRAVDAEGLDTGVLR